MGITLPGTAVDVVGGIGSGLSQPTGTAQPTGPGPHRSIAFLHANVAYRGITQAAAAAPHPDTGTLNHLAHAHNEAAHSHAVPRHRDSTPHSHGFSCFAFANA